MKVFSGTDIGQRRTVNQDYTFVSDKPVGNLPNLFIVADGMGGHNAGDFASSYAVKVLLENIESDADFNPIKVLRHAMEAANEELLAQAAAVEERKGMGTTMVAACIVGNYVYVANVGDSRLYVIDNTITQITRDHSLVQEMVRLGELREEDAQNHPDKNIITRAIGASASLDVDFFDYRLTGTSTILICTDGLSNMVSNEEIKEIIHRPQSVEEKGRELIRKANANGGKDNIAVVLIEPFTKEVEVC